MERSIATDPVPGNDYFASIGDEAQWERTNKMMNQVVALVAAQPPADACRLLFVGDSILYSLQLEASDTWAKHYGRFGALNLSIMGDQTQHILWRLAGGNLKGLRPELAVLLAGTNNSLKNSAGDTVAGIEAIVRLLQERLPRVRVLLLELLPRADSLDANTECQKVNAALRLLYGEQQQQQGCAAAQQGLVKLFSLESVFCAEGGQVRTELMPDGLHPGPAGYQKMAEARAGEVAATLESGARTARSSGLL